MRTNYTTIWNYIGPPRKKKLATPLSPLTLLSAVRSIQNRFVFENRTSGSFSICDGSKKIG